MIRQAPVALLLAALFFSQLPLRAEDADGLPAAADNDPLNAVVKLEVTRAFRRPPPPAE